jgi:MFS family permease
MDGRPDPSIHPTTSPYHLACMRGRAASSPTRPLVFRTGAPPGAPSTSPTAVAEPGPSTRPPAAFWLLAAINVLVGGMVGLERTVVPLLGRDVFGLDASAALAAFVISFGVAKAVFNLFAGAWADRIGRRQVLRIGWALGLPIPLLLIWAPSWPWIVAANVLLGINQALTWSMTVNMMIDLVPAHRRGFAAGINEFAGYAGVSLLAFLTGLIAASHGLRPEPFYLGIGVSVLGLVLSFMVRETAPSSRPSPLRWVPRVGVPSLLGAATNLKDGLVWLALPLMMTTRGFDLVQVGAVAGLYPLVWAGGQIVFGPLSDRYGRRRLILPGMLLQALGLLAMAVLPTFGGLLAAAVVLGLGTGMVYPTLIALVADRVPLAERATALGVYRFFRDGGYALGAIVATLSLGGIAGVIAAVGVALGLTTYAVWRRV